MRIAIAVLMMVHGFAHLPGFLGSWRLGVVEGVPYHTTLFTGRIDVGDTGMRVIGVLWLVGAAAFTLVAVAALLDRSWWWTGATVTAVLSLGLCASEMPAARLGLVLNAVLLILLFVASRQAGVSSARLVP